MVNARNFNTFM